MLIKVSIAKAIVKYTVTKAAKGESVNPRPALYAIDTLGNDNGMIEWEDVVAVLKDFGCSAVEKITDVISFIDDLV